jgi:hypothetical protein
MQRYDLTDKVTIYFAVYIDPNTKDTSVKAYSDNKFLMETYLSFHNCKNLVLRTTTQTWEELIPIVNADEINGRELTILRLNSRNRSNKKRGPTEIVAVPGIDPEIMHVHDMSKDFCSAIVNYSAIQDHLTGLKRKYQEALATLGLFDVVRKTVYGQDSRFTNSVFMDEVMVLLRFFQDEFGE